MAEPVDVGIVVGGAGAVAQIEALRGVPEARLLGVGGHDALPVLELARKRGAEVFPSLKALLEVEALDLVVVASPRAERGKHALAALAAGKHTWVVPPLASMAEMQRLEAAAGKAGVRLCLALTARHHPAVQALRGDIARGRIGQVAMARYALRLHDALAADALAAQLAEAIDLLGLLTDKAPATVFAAAHERPGAYAMAHLALQDNVIGTAEVHVAPSDAKAFPPREQLIVVGTKGTRRAGTSSKGKLIHSGAEPLAGHVEALRAMVRHVRGGPPPMPQAEARAAVEACLAAERSAKRGQPVTLGAGRAG